MAWPWDFTPGASPGSEPPDKEAGSFGMLIQQQIFLYGVADLEAIEALASRHQESQDTGIRLQGLHCT